MIRPLWNIEPPSFKVEPEYLSEEHAKQVERFTGVECIPEADATGKAYGAFQRWLHKQLMSRK